MGFRFLRQQQFRGSLTRRLFCCGVLGSTADSLSPKTRGDGNAARNRGLRAGCGHPVPFRGKRNEGGMERPLSATPAGGNQAFDIRDDLFQTFSVHSARQPFQSSYPLL